MISPDFQLKVNDSTYEGWTDINVRRSIDRMSGAFNVGRTLLSEESFLDNNLIPGCEIEVHINGSPVLIGYVDALGSQYEKNQAGLSIAGRDRVSDLIDCAASVDGPFEFNGQRINQILGAILKPYNIPIQYEVDTGAPFKRIAIEPGESAFDLIERLCRYRSLLPISDGLGGLIITKPGIEKSRGKLVYAENILSGDITLDQTNRFSLVVVKGQEEGSDENSAEDVAGGEGRAYDKFVTRYRPKVIVGATSDSKLSLTDLAKWDVSMSRARAITANYKVQGWTTDGEEDLWKPNTIVPVLDPIRGLSRDMLIKDVSFDRSNAGTTTTLGLVLPEAFDLPAEAEPDEDILGGL